jgi:hypothetical protein
VLNDQGDDCVQEKVILVAIQTYKVLRQALRILLDPHTEDGGLELTVKPGEAPQDGEEFEEDTDSDSDPKNLDEHRDAKLQNEHKQAFERIVQWTYHILALDKVDLAMIRS